MSRRGSLEGCEGMISLKTSTDERDDKLKNNLNSRISSVAKILDSTYLATMNHVKEDRLQDGGCESSPMECSSSKDISILLVDDSISILKMCSRSLTREVSKLLIFGVNFLFSLFSQLGTFLLSLDVSNYVEIPHLLSEL